jgi:hypothetical protein
LRAHPAAAGGDGPSGRAQWPAFVARRPRAYRPTASVVLSGGGTVEMHTRCPAESGRILLSISANLQVFHDGESGKYFAPFRHLNDSEANDVRRWHTGNVLAFEEDGAFPRGKDTGE